MLKALGSEADPKPVLEFLEGKEVITPIEGSFRKMVLKEAGKISKKSGPDAAAAFLNGKWENRPPNFQPPAKALIVAQSRPFDEWPIAKASCAIQQHVYSLAAKLVLDAEKKSSKWELEPSFVPEAKKEAHVKWFKDTGVDDCGFKSTQGLNLIF